MSHAGIPESLIDEIKRASSILELAAEVTQLAAQPTDAAEVRALCPFHDDHDPSMSLNEAKGLYHCYACRAGGDVIEFVVQSRGLTFIEAIHLLADRARIEIPGDPVPGGIRNARLIAATGAAQAQLVAKAQASLEFSSFLETRGISAETARRYGLGFAPGGGAIVQALMKAGFEESDLLDAGIAVRRADGITDFLYRRVTFPFTDAASNVIGWAGRDITGRSPSKYVNVRNSALYTKGRHLFGGAQAIPAARKASAIFVVEGYMDAIALWQSGRQNVVALGGTAMTDAQAMACARLAPTVLLCLDNDVAGRAATLSALDRLDGLGVDSWVVLLSPAVKDASELLAAHFGAQEFDDATSTALSGQEFRILSVLSAGDHDTARGRDAIEVKLRALLDPWLSSIPRGRLLRVLEMIDVWRPELFDVPGYWMGLRGEPDSLERAADAGPAGARPTDPSRTESSGFAGVDSETRHELIALRREVAAERAVPEEAVVSDRAIAEIVARRPSTPEELATIWGLGATRIENLSDRILEIVVSTSTRRQPGVAVVESSDQQATAARQRKLDASRQLARSTSERAHVLLLQMTHDGDETVRGNAYTCLGASLFSVQPADIEAGLSDAAPKVRRRALEAVETRWPERSGAAATALLTDPDKDVLHTALLLLRDRGGQDAIEALRPHTAADGQTGRQAIGTIQAISRRAALVRGVEVDGHMVESLRLSAASRKSLRRSGVESVHDIETASAKGWDMPKPPSPAVRAEAEAAVSDARSEVR